MQRGDAGLLDTQRLAALSEDHGLRVPSLLGMEFIRNTEATKDFMHQSLSIGHGLLVRDNRLRPRCEAEDRDADKPIPLRRERQGSYHVHCHPFHISSNLTELQGGDCDAFEGSSHSTRHMRCTTLLHPSEKNADPVERLAGAQYLYNPNVSTCDTVVHIIQEGLLRRYG